jgi:thioredoxin-related protein
MKCLLILILIGPLYCVGQNEYKGIKWETTLSWDQVRQKAQKENKYIFLDCFATWCGPCKEMEKYVYTNDTIGKYFNDKFISVKVQMDRTENDNDEVKSWYKASESIAKQYKITGYPSFLFFSATGDIIGKEEGFKSINELKTIAQTATSPNHVYIDPFADYDSLVENYRHGIRVYDRIPYMVEQAKKIHNVKLADSLVKDYYSYLDNLERRKLFTQTIIGFIASNLKSSQDKYFHLFYPNGRKVDGLMKKHGYARAVVDKVIQIEEINPFMDRFRKSHSFKTAAEVTEPNWTAVSYSITARYGFDYAQRAVRMAQQDFYWWCQNKPGFIKTVMSQIQNYDYDTSDLPSRYGMMNVCSWMIFESSNNRDTIDTAIRWMEEVLRSRIYVTEAFLLRDTYGNLLYKASMLYDPTLYDDALFWEEKALENAIEEEGTEGGKMYQEYLDKMKKRVPTW